MNIVNWSNAALGGLGFAAVLACVYLAVIGYPSSAGAIAIAAGIDAMLLWAIRTQQRADASPARQPRRSISSHTPFEAITVTGAH